MGIAAFTGLVLCALVVIGFMVYGAFLGLATLASLVNRAWTRVLALETGGGTLALGGSLKEEPSGEGRVRRPCWETNGCAESARQSCPAFQRPDLPCWLAHMEANPDLRLKPDCLACKLFNIPALMTGV